MFSFPVAMLLVVALVSGCATVSPPATTLPAPSAPTVPVAPRPYVEPPPPPVNLQGFPPSYRLGFGDGCATGRGTDKRDSVRYANDNNYRIGWHDGASQCKKR